MTSIKSSSVTKPCFSALAISGSSIVSVFSSISSDIMTAIPPPIASQLERSALQTMRVLTTKKRRTQAFGAIAQSRGLMLRPCAHPPWLCGIPCTRLQLYNSIRAVICQSLFWAGPSCPAGSFGHASTRRCPSLLGLAPRPLRALNHNYNAQTPLVNTFWPPDYESALLHAWPWVT